MMLCWAQAGQRLVGAHQQDGVVPEDEADEFGRAGADHAGDTAVGASRAHGDGAHRVGDNTEPLHAAGANVQHGCN